MADEVKDIKGNWDDDFRDDANGGNSDKPAGGGGSYVKTEFLKMDTPGDYKVRLVGSYIKCYKHFLPYKATVQKSEKTSDPAWVAGWYPNERFAINVIDRADGKIKVLEKGRSVFKHFNNYRTIFGKDPTKTDGPDWLIRVTVPKGKDGKPNKFKTEYTVTHLETAPFKKEEIELIKSQGLWPLTKIFKSTPAESMQKMWDDLPADKKIAPKRDYDNKGAKPEAPKTPAKSGAEPLEESMGDAPSNNGSDPFADKGSSDNDPSAELF